MPGFLFWVFAWAWTDARAESPISSPCTAAPSMSEMVRSAMDLRPSATAVIQREAQNKGRADMQARMSALTQPVISRANQLMQFGAGCRDVACAASFNAQAQGFYSDVVGRVVPQLKAMADEAKGSSPYSADMDPRKLMQNFERLTGRGAPQGRGGVTFLPLCRAFQVRKLETTPDWAKLSSRRDNPESRSLSEARSLIQATNRAAAGELGEWVCHGRIGWSYRCFKKEPDPSNLGRACEKVGTAVTCHDPNGVWTPPNFWGKTSTDPMYRSWFDEPPPKFQVLAGGVPLPAKEEAPRKDAPPPEQFKVKDQPPVKPEETPPKDAKPHTQERPEPPVPFEVWEQKIRSGKGLTPSEITKLTDNDWIYLGGLLNELKKESDTPGSVVAAQQLAGKGLEAADRAGGWLSDNKEHVKDSLQMLEVMSLIAMPAQRPLAVALDATATGLTVATKLLVLKSEHPDSADVPGALAKILGPEVIKAVGEKRLAKAFVEAGQSEHAAEFLASLTVKSANAGVEHHLEGEKKE